MNGNRAEKSLKFSTMIAPVEALTALGSNIVLIGILVRHGGLPLVGQWAMLQAVVAIVLAFDFGLGYGIVRRVAIDGSISGFRSAALASICAIAVALAFGLTGWLGKDLLVERGTAAIALALAAGAIQLLAQWWSAIQTGSHRHSVAQISRIVLNLIQLLIVMGFLLKNQSFEIFKLSVIILVSRLCQFFFVIAVSWRIDEKFRSWAFNIRIAEFDYLWSTISQFIIFSAALRFQFPMLRIIVGFLGGDAALGVVAIAQRIPEVVFKIFSGGLQTIVPSIASEGELDRITNIVNKALFIQITFCLPIIVYMIMFARSIVYFWLGTDDALVSDAVRAMCIGASFVTVALPYYWLLHAVGLTPFMGYIMIVQFIITFLFAVLCFWLIKQNILLFVVGLSVFWACAHIVYILRGVHELGNFKYVRRTRWRVPVTSSIVSSGCAFILGTISIYSLDSLFVFLVKSSLFAFIYGIISYRALRVARIF